MTAVAASRRTLRIRQVVEKVGLSAPTIQNKTSSRKGEPVMTKSKVKREMDERARAMTVEDRAVDYLKPEPSRSRRRDCDEGDVQIGSDMEN